MISHTPYLIVPFPGNDEDLEIYFDHLEEAWEITRQDLIDLYFVFHTTFLMNHPQEYRAGLPIDVVEFLMNWLAEKFPTVSFEYEEIVPVLEEVMSEIYQHLFIPLRYIHQYSGVPGPLQFLKWHGDAILAGTPTDNWDLRTPHP